MSIRIDQIYGEPQYVMEVLTILQHEKLPCVIASWGSLEDEDTPFAPFVIDFNYNRFTIEEFKKLIFKFQVKADSRIIDAVYFKIVAGQQKINLKVYEGMDYDFSQLEDKAISYD